MTLEEIADMCDCVLYSKATEYATPDQRWHNFIEAAERAKDFNRGSLLQLSPEAWACAFAMKHYISCRDIDQGILVASPEVIREKAGDLVNYYLIYTCIVDGFTNPDTLTWLRELYVSKREPWYLGLKLLMELDS